VSVTNIDLPLPEETVAAAARTAGDPADAAAVNLVVPVLATNSEFTPGSVERTEGGYVGPGADDLGRLAAAVAATQESTCLHYPEPDTSATGPWLVVEPLAGRLSTVHAGTGIARVALDPPADGETALLGIRDRLGDVLAAAHPTHEYYPIGEYEQTVFTTGMTTFSLDGVAVEEDQITVTFSVSTTPVTTARAVEDCFESCEGVLWTTYEPLVGVERAAPPRELRTAAEAAAEAVIGDWEYEWFPKPTTFSRIPGGTKLALGASEPGTDTYRADTHATTVRLLRKTIARFGGTP
jgi:hypothetical protein